MSNQRKHFNVLNVTFYQKHFVIDFISSKGTLCHNCYRFKTKKLVGGANKWLKDNGVKEFYGEDVLQKYKNKGLVIQEYKRYISGGALYVGKYEKNAAGKLEFVEYERIGFADSIFSASRGLFA